MKLTIDRNVWMRGQTLRGAVEYCSKLLRFIDDERKQCCVGLYLTALGAPDESIVDMGYASGFRGELPRHADWLTCATDKDPKAHTEDAKLLYQTNDSDMISPERREKAIAEIFLKHGVEVEFV